MSNQHECAGSACIIDPSLVSESSPIEENPRVAAYLADVAATARTWAPTRELEADAVSTAVELERGNLMSADWLAKRIIHKLGYTVE